MRMMMDEYDDEMNDGINEWWYMMINDDDE